MKRIVRVWDEESLLFKYQVQERKWFIFPYWKPLPGLHSYYKATFILQVSDSAKK